MRIQLHADNIEATEVNPFLGGAGEPFVWVDVILEGASLGVCVSSDSLTQTRALATALNAAADAVEQAVEGSVPVETLAPEAVA